MTMSDALPHPPSFEPLTIATRNFGSITVRPDQVITITPGLVGFSGRRGFTLVEGHYDPPFLGFQCLEDPDLAFVLINPVHLLPDYRLHLPLGFQKGLGPCRPEDLQILVFLTIPRGKPEETTANLASPLIINPQTGRAKRIFIDNPDFSPQHRVFAGFAKGKKKTP